MEIILLYTNLELTYVKRNDAMLTQSLRDVIFPLVLVLSQRFEIYRNK